MIPYLAFGRLLTELHISETLQLSVPVAIHNTSIRRRNKDITTIKSLTGCVAPFEMISWLTYPLSASDSISE